LFEQGGNSVLAALLSIALRLRCVARREVYHLLCNLIRESMTIACSDFCEHHVQTRDTAGTSHAISIDDKQLITKVRIAVTFSERISAMPVNRHGITIQQTSMCEYVSTQFGGTEDRILARDQA